MSKRLKKFWRDTLPRNFMKAFYPPEEREVVDKQMDKLLERRRQKDKSKGRNRR